MICLYICLPESPAWCATRPDKGEMGKKMLLRLNHGVPHYNVDKQWEVLKSTVAHEQEVAQANKSIGWWNIFRGVNGVSIESG